MKTQATRIVEGSRVDRALAIMERAGDYMDSSEFRDILLDMSTSKDQAGHLRNDLMKRGLIRKTVKYEITPLARTLTGADE